jgi:alpha-L-rhamnosidase
MKRREFIKSTALSGGAALLAPNFDRSGVPAKPSHSAVASTSLSRPRMPDLSPARWIWYPSGRCLQNTFILFRREVELSGNLRRAIGWIAADSRYLLEVNGRRIQWGPAPSDPRWPEADPVDLTGVLQSGRNIIGATVLFYGQGDGTWPTGRPGFLFSLEVDSGNGKTEKVVSDASWKALLARAWKPGHYKRWYLRSLQEEFDARLYPDGWSERSYIPTGDWLAAMPLDCPSNRPSLASSYSEYMLDIGSGPADTEIRPRSIPLLRETLVPVRRLAESLWLEWSRSPEEYFECRTPGAYRPDRRPCAAEIGAGAWTVQLDESRGAVLAFELNEQVVGWPYFTIEAPAGTTVELLVHEAHEVGGPPLLDTHFDSWTRFVCREGRNRFECFDFESCRWLQLHIRGNRGAVSVREVGVRRRQFPWPNEPRVRCSEPGLQRLLDASINTLNNCAQETLVDGMARERQQYSGDCGHQTHAIYFAFGETRLPARYLTTFSQGQTLDGYFLDCWPAYDRLARLMERQLELTGWGPILDHGIGFNFDCWHHYLYTGNIEALQEPYPRLLRFADYLKSIVGQDGLLPVENLGIPSVWIDHNAYRRQRHKQCAFNLYAAAMLEHALAPLCRAFGNDGRARSAVHFGRSLLAAAVQRFWSPERGLFVNNLPWLSEEKSLRLCDRSLATAILFDQCLQGRIEPALRALADCPPEMGFSYPANAGWRLWALAKGGRADIITKDLRERWATMASVRLNNTLQEDWLAHPDSGNQWSHCAVVPLYITYMGLAGIRPLTPGFKRVEIRPQPADLEQLELTAHTVRGPLRFDAHGKRGERELFIELPVDCEGELVLPGMETVDLAPAPGPVPLGQRRYQISSARATSLKLRFT